tara:strand:- start:10881 stop:11546 length:666 start_codon:yes stop_codon:yes gene_type:complete
MNHLILSEAYLQQFNADYVKSDIVRSGNPYIDGELHKLFLKTLKQQGLTSILNLGDKPEEGEEYARAEREWAAINCVNYGRIGLEGSNYEPLEKWEEMMDFVQGNEGLMLIHCKYGADRTGIGVTLALYLRHAETLEDAFKEGINPRFNKTKFNMLDHTIYYFLTEVFPKREMDFENWLKEEYDPEVLKKHYDKKVADSSEETRVRVFNQIADEGFLHHTT